MKLEGHISLTEEISRESFVTFSRYWVATFHGTEPDGTEVTLSRQDSTPAEAKLKCIGALAKLGYEL